MTIRKQLFISFISSIVISTLFLLVLYKMMWFDVHQTLVLTAFSLISSLITVMIAMTFLVPTIHRLEKLNLQTQKVSEGHFNIFNCQIKCNTLSLKSSAGVFQSNRLRGRVFNL